MRAVGIDPAHWRGRRVFVTGHTGFLGGWMCLWLSKMDADVAGYALNPPTTPSFFDSVGLGQRIRSTIADVRDLGRLKAEVQAFDPEVVIHLAAQPLVREAHAAPVDTFATNVMGTANLMEAIRGAASLQAAVIMTTDKVYDNVEWDWGYRETDRLGAREPYGGSKACAELVVEAFHRSYMAKMGIATVRAGNIVGGGDWAADRLVPDAARAFSKAMPLEIRNPNAVRPWQHVLEPGAGILRLCERLAAEPDQWSGAWNFGPPEGDSRSVREMADSLVRMWGDDASWTDTGKDDDAPYEARLLTLNSMKALSRLGWRPRWSFERTLAATVEWYRQYVEGGDMHQLSIDQIAAYEGAN